MRALQLGQSWLFRVFTSSELHEAGDDDDEECQELAVGEEILNQGGPLNLPAVDEGQHTWKQVADDLIAAVQNESFNLHIVSQCHSYCCVTTLCLNNALWLDDASHATSFDNSKLFVSS